MHEDNAPVTCARFSPNGKFVLAWTLDSCIRLWNYVDGRCVKTYQGHVNTTYSLGGAFGTYGSEDHRGGSSSAKMERGGVVQERANRQKAFLVSGSETGEVFWWDVQSKEVLQREAAHDGVVLDVDTWDGEEGGMAVSCGVDRTVRVWATQDGGAGDEGGNGGGGEVDIEDEEEIEGEGEDMDE